MSSNNSNPIVALSKLSKPVDTLIKKVSNAAGVLYEPHHIERIAKAKAKADLIDANSKIEITELHRRAANRWLEEEAQRQANMENILANALSEVEDSSKPNEVEDDWIVNFFDKCRIVSDSQMQTLWSRVLAGEANFPGSYSKRTVNFLSDLDKSDAQLFIKLCGFAWNIGYPIPLVFDLDAEFYKERDISFVNLKHLDSIGLTNFSDLAGYKLQDVSGKGMVHYYGRLLELNFGSNSVKELPLGSVMFTRIGKELAAICGGRPVDGFWEYVKEQWKDFLQENKTD